MRDRSRSRLSPRCTGPVAAAALGTLGTLAALATRAAPAAAEIAAVPPACPGVESMLVPRVLHKALITLPADVAADPARRAAAIAKLRKQVRELLVDYGAAAASPVLVLADQRQLDRLAAGGTGSTIVDVDDLAIFGGTAIDTLGRARLEPPLAAPAGWTLRARPAQPVPYKVVLIGPPADGPWLEHLDAELTELGLARAAAPDYTIAIAMTPAQARAVARLPEVAWVGRYEPLAKVPGQVLGASCGVVPPGELARRAARAGADADVVSFEVVYADGDASLITAEIVDGGGAVGASGDQRLEVTGPRGLVRVLATDPHVLMIGPAPIRPPIPEPARPR